jgi:hypothetical protein
VWRIDDFRLPIERNVVSCIGYSEHYFPRVLSSSKHERPMTPSGKVQTFLLRREIRERIARESGDAQQESDHG